ncbi:MAG: hypothetical protein V5B32_06980 [Candidatus Accumulibacter sp. UW26]
MFASVLSLFTMVKKKGHARRSGRPPDASIFGSRHAVKCGIIRRAANSLAVPVSEQNDAGGLRRDAQEKFAPMKESFLPKAFPIVRLQAATCAKIPPANGGFEDHAQRRTNASLPHRRLQVKKKASFMRP